MDKNLKNQKDNANDDAHADYKLKELREQISKLEESYKHDYHHNSYEFTEKLSERITLFADLNNEELNTLLTRSKDYYNNNIHCLREPREEYDDTGKKILITIVIAIVLYESIVPQMTVNPNITPLVCYAVVSIIILLSVICIVLLIVKRNIKRKKYEDSCRKYEKQLDDNYETWIFEYEKPIEAFLKRYYGK